jgi:hypothetical protein
MAGTGGFPAPTRANQVKHASLHACADSVGAWGRPRRLRVVALPIKRTGRCDGTAIRRSGPRIADSVWENWVGGEQSRRRNLPISPTYIMRRFLNLVNQRIYSEAGATADHHGVQGEEIRPNEAFRRVAPGTVGQTRPGCSGGPRAGRRACPRCLHPLVQRSRRPAALAAQVGGRG